MIVDEGLEGEVQKLNTMLLHVGSFVLSNSTSVMKNFNHNFDGFHSNGLHYGDID